MSSRNQPPDEDSGEDTDIYDASPRRETRPGYQATTSRTQSGPPRGPSPPHGFGSSRNSPLELASRPGGIVAAINVDNSQSSQQAAWQHASGSPGGASMFAANPNAPQLMFSQQAQQFQAPTTAPRASQIQQQSQQFQARTNAPQASQTQQSQQFVPIQSAPVPPPNQRVTRPPVMTDAYNFTPADLNRIPLEFTGHADEGQGDPRLAYDDHPRREREPPHDAKTRILAARLKLGIQGKDEVPIGTDQRIRNYVRIYKDAASARRSFRNGTEIDHMYKLDPMHATFDQAYVNRWRLSKRNRQKNNALAEEALWRRVRQWQAANGMPLEPPYDPAEDSGDGLYDQEFETTFNKLSQNPYEKCRRCVSKKAVEGPCSTTVDNIIPCTLCVQRGKPQICERVRPLVPRIRGAPYMAGAPFTKPLVVPKMPPPPVVKTIWNGPNPPGLLPAPVYHVSRGGSKKHKEPKTVREKGKGKEQEQEQEKEKGKGKGKEKAVDKSSDADTDVDNDTENHADRDTEADWDADEMLAVISRSRDDINRYRARGGDDYGVGGSSRRQPQGMGTMNPYTPETNRHGLRNASPQFDIGRRTQQSTEDARTRDRRFRGGSMNSSTRQRSASPRRESSMNRRPHGYPAGQRRNYVAPSASTPAQNQESFPAPAPTSNFGFIDHALLAMLDELDGDSPTDSYENLQNTVNSILRLMTSAPYQGDAAPGAGPASVPNSARATNQAPYANEQIQPSMQALAALNQHQNRTAPQGNGFNGQQEIGHRSRQEATNAYAIFSRIHAIAPLPAAQGPNQPFNNWENLLNIRFADAEFPQLNAQGTTFLASPGATTNAQLNDNFQLSFSHVAFIHSHAGQTEVLTQHKPEEILPGYRFFPKGHAGHLNPVKEDKPCENDLTLWDRLGNPQLRDLNSTICEVPQTAACETISHVHQFASCFPICEEEQSRRVETWFPDFLSKTRAFMCLPCGQTSTQALQNGSVPLEFFRENDCLCIDALFKGHLCNQHVVNGWKQVASILARTNVWMLRAASTGTAGAQINNFCLQCGQNEQYPDSGYWTCKCCHTIVIDSLRVGSQLMSTVGLPNT